jgi:photosystem I reaction center subunit XII
MPISDSQVFIALFIALMTGILAIRLGVALYD